MLVIHNAVLHTLDPKIPRATSLAIDHGKVIAVGSENEILSKFSTSDLFNAHGHAIIPGLTDAHIHLEDYSLSLTKVNCGTPTMQQCLQRIAARVIATPSGEWVLGHGWNQNNWSGTYGSASLLDDIAPNNPIYLTHKSLHSAWVNSQTLHLAGITRDTPDPEGGIIGRLTNGDPNGILFESATTLIERLLPEHKLEQVINLIQKTITTLWQMGLTGVHDFDSSRCFAALQILHRDNKLKLRVLKNIHLEDLPSAIELGVRSGFGDDFLRIGSLKMFSDGALGPHTAAMLEPYDDDPQNLGILEMQADEIYEYGCQAVRNGISLAIHAIGDRANRIVLDAYTRLREFESTKLYISQDQMRHRIEHVQVLQPEDVARFSELNILASMQPIHATSDMLVADRCWGKRAANAYAWRSQLTHGSQLVFGSDAPVESPNPFWGIHAAVTRKRVDGTPSPRGWYPEQRLSVDEAINAYTIGPAFAAGMENCLGKLSPGYLADLLILNADPYSCSPDELIDIKPLATMVGGEWVYSVLE